MNKNIIIVALIIIIIAIVSIFVFNLGNTGKMNTQINFLSESTLQNGNQIQIELKDAQGNPIANEVINFTYDANGHQEKIFCSNK
ncbi:MAG: type IV pilin [Methanobrevibacter thaueri]|nr:type IV pilin [Methanobrevibacter thaueri]